MLVRFVYTVVLICGVAFGGTALVGLMCENYVSVSRFLAPVVGQHFTSVIWFNIFT